MKDRFYNAEVLKVTGITRPTLQQWLQAGFIEPQYEKAHGPGSRNVFGINDLYKIVLLKKLIENGMSREKAAAQVGCVFPYGIVKWNPGNYFTITFTKLSTGDMAGSNKFGDVDGLAKDIGKGLKSGYDIITIYNIEKIIREVEGAVKEL